MTGARPRLDVRVTAPNIQLDDFPLARRAPARRPGQRLSEDLRATARGAATQTQALLSAAFLRRLDAYLDVEVRQVLSGNDRLGDGSWCAQIVEGRLYLGPAEVNLPGGTAKLSILYDPTRARSISPPAPTSSASTTASWRAGCAARTTCKASSA